MGGKKRCNRKRDMKNSNAQNDDSTLTVATVQTLNLTDLPAEILQKIFDYVNIWHHNRIRATCSRLRDVHDEYLVHRFKVMLHHAVRAEEADIFDTYECALLRSLNMATEFFCVFGNHSSFSRCFMPLMHHCYNSAFEPPLGKVAKCLQRFYEYVEMEEITKSRCSRLLYTLTLFRLLLDLTSPPDNIFVKNYVSLQIKVTLHGKWIGCIYNNRCQTVNSTQQRHNNLLVMLHELLVYSKMSVSKKRIWDVENAVYLLGYEVHPARHRPSASINIIISGTPGLLQIFENILLRQADFGDIDLNCIYENFHISIHVMSTGISGNTNCDFIDFTPPVLD